ncbi:MAG: thymidylate kinase, partial [Pseudomonadota bacterium]
DPAKALSRGLARRSGEDRFEDMGESFQAELRRGFQDLVASKPDRCHLIDGDRDPDTVAADVLPKALDLLS